MIETLLTVFSGGAAGVVGSVLGKAAGYFEKKQEMEARREEYSHELKLLELQMKDASEQRENEAAFEARKASYSHDASAGETYKWIAAILRLVRPVLTLLLITLTAIVYMNATEEVRADVAAQVIFLTGMTISWWFGDRYKPGTLKR
jgi:hypothetical protein